MITTDVQFANYKTYKSAVGEMRQSLEKAINADESRKSATGEEQIERIRKAMALYRKALRDMNSLLSIKLANCPVNRQKEVGEQQKKARDFKEQSEERIGILESELLAITGSKSVCTVFSNPNTSMSASVAPLPSTRRQLTTRNSRPTSATRDKSVLLRNVNPKYGEEILSAMINKTDVKLSNVDGNEAAKKALEENVIFPALNPTLFSGLLAPTPGILFFGPPGNGKTMIAKAIANECGSTFFNISAASIMSKWVGDGERLVQALFQVARNAQPSIIFIDEVDSMLCERSENEQGASRRVKTEFLIQLDGCSSQSEDRILILAATNRPQELDEGILRRFPQRIFIDLPDANARENMIRRTFKQYNTSTKMSDRDFNRIASLTENYSYSDLMALCRAAALLPVKALDRAEIQKLSAKELSPVDFHCLELALQQVKPSTNLENRKRLLEFAKKYAIS